MKLKQKIVIIKIYISVNIFRYKSISNNMKIIVLNKIKIFINFFR